MKRKGLAVTLSAAGAFVVLLLTLFAVLISNGNEILAACCVIIESSSVNAGSTEDPQVTDCTVQLLETRSDTLESSYRVGAALPPTDFSSLGQILTGTLARIGVSLCIRCAERFSCARADSTPYGIMRLAAIK